ncbi:PIG-L family deacetylase [Aquirufa sp. ROCK-SH2]
MKYTLLILLFCLNFRSTFAQQKSSSQLYEDLKAIQVLGTVLHVAAHPDDESTNVLTWFARDQHWETNYFSCTRGDGGQNLIGDEQGIALGLIRTQELLAARRLDGAHQYFSQAIDFGFSKSTDEALKIWNKELILSNLVYVIRKTRPDILFTRFPPDSRAGHGQHSASTVLAIEAFKAAADPNRFPEQLKNGITVWQAKRLLWNTFRFPGSANSTISEDQFKFDIGNFIPALGQSTGELAALSRSQHKSQGFGFAIDRGKTTEYFVTLAGDSPKRSIDDGINTSWARIENGQSIQEDLDNVIQRFNMDQPYLSIEAMVNLKKKIQGISDTFWKKKKLEEINQWIVQASGISFSSTTDKGMIAKSDTFKVKHEFIVRTPVKIENLTIKTGGIDTTIRTKIEPYKKINWIKNIQVGNKISQAYWLEKSREKGHFGNENPEKIGQADVDPALMSRATFRILGEEFHLEKAVQELIIDPVKGELNQPIAITPKTTFSIIPNILLFPTGSKAKKTSQIVITALSNLAPGKIHVVTNENKEISVFDLTNSIKKGDRISIPISFSESELTSLGKTTLNFQLQFETKNGQWIDSLELQKIAYDHIPTQRYYNKVNLEILHIDFKKQGKLIGYIKGAGDRVPEALTQMGYDVKMLAESDLTFENLKKYDAVVTGIRAYNTLDYLSNAYTDLMKYIENGGNYVVQYNTASFLGPMNAEMAPYPLKVGRTRITDETAKPEFLLPQHAVFNQPNKINFDDFSEWVQERSIYNGVSDDSRVEFPLGFTDPKESLDKGNIALINYGKGRFIYTGLVFFRELPASVPGAWRLFSNLISNPNSK